MEELRSNNLNSTMRILYAILLVKPFSIHYSSDSRCSQQSGDDICGVGAEFSKGEDRETCPNRNAPRAVDQVDELGVRRKLVVDQLSEIFRDLIIHDELRETVRCQYI